MFETEAGFAETKMLINCHGDYSKKQDYKKGWQDGAEFGYNKAKEEMQEQGLALQSDMNKTIEQNISLKEQIEQIEKMKCCEMCKHKNLNWGFSPICKARDNIKIENPLTCNSDKWEIKEND